MVNQDKILIVSVLVVGVVVFGILITFIGQGEVRHVEIFLTEQVKQTVAFQEELHLITTQTTDYYTLQTIIQITLL